MYWDIVSVFELVYCYNRDIENNGESPQEIGGRSNCWRLRPSDL